MVHRQYSERIFGIIHSQRYPGVVPELLARVIVVTPVFTLYEEYHKTDRSRAAATRHFRMWPIVIMHVYYTGLG
jgi:hypothetical protein